MSIDHMHASFMEQFQESIEKVPEQKERVSELEKILEEINIMDARRMDIEREIQDIRTQIERAEKQTDYVEYIANVGDIIRKNSRLQVEDSTPENQEKQKGLLKHVNYDILSTDKDLVDEYLRLTKQNLEMEADYNMVNKETARCDYCGSSNIRVIWRESSKGCLDCGSSSMFTDRSENQWSDTVQVNVKYTYEQVTYFKIHLSQLQGKESKIIPDKIIEKVQKEMRKYRIPPEKLTRERLMKILKSIKANNYYKNINLIRYKITGEKPPQLPAHLEDRLVTLFKATLKPFEKHKTENRKNYFNYSYVIHKLLLIIARREPEIKKYIKYLSLLKSRDKLIVQDEMWKKVTNTLGWEFDPSV